MSLYMESTLECTSWSLPIRLYSPYTKCKDQIKFHILRSVTQCPCDDSIISSNVISLCITSKGVFRTLSKMYDEHV